MIHGTARTRRNMLLGGTIASALAMGANATAPTLTRASKRKRKKVRPPIAALTAHIHSTTAYPSTSIGPVISVRFRCRGLDMRVDPPTILSVDDYEITLKPSELGTSALRAKLRYQVATTWLARPASQADRVYIEFV